MRYSSDVLQFRVGEVVPYPPFAGLDTVAFEGTTVEIVFYHPRSYFEIGDAMEVVVNGESVSRDAALALGDHVLVRLKAQASQCPFDTASTPEKVRRATRSAANDLFDIKQAAEYLGMSPTKLRKIVNRSRRRSEGRAVSGATVQFQQDGVGSQILFKQEWLNDYLDGTTLKPDDAKLLTPVPRTKSHQRGKDKTEIAEGKHINFDYLD